MTRFRYGGDASAWVVDALDGSAQFGVGQQIVGLPLVDVTVPLYATSGGSPVIDFTDIGGAPLSSIVVPAGTPYLPFFFGPDSLTELWFQDVAGNWRLLQPSDMGKRLGVAEQAITVLQISGGGGGGGDPLADRDVYQISAGTGGWPARPDGLTNRFTWWGPDQPPIGTISGSLYMAPLDVYERTDEIVDTTP